MSSFKNLMYYSIQSCSEKKINDNSSFVIPNPLKNQAQHTIHESNRDRVEKSTTVHDSNARWKINHKTSFMIPMPGKKINHITPFRMKYCGSFFNAPSEITGVGIMNNSFMTPMPVGGLGELWIIERVACSP